MRISDWSSDVCSSDLVEAFGRAAVERRQAGLGIAIEELHQGEARADARLVGALQAIADLALQQLGRAVEQVDLDQAVGKAGDDPVALGTGRRQLHEDRKSTSLNSSH